MPPAEFSNAINQLSQNQSALAKAIEAMQLKSANEDARQQLEAQKELYAVMTSATANYTNIIIVAGYAGILSILSSLSVKMQPIYLYIVGFFLVLSLGSFISFEIYKMISQTRHVDAVFSRMNSSKIQPVDALAMVKREINSFNVKNVKIWSFFLYFTIITGVIAALVLLCSLGVHIFLSMPIV
ncbi:hypothetical protein [Aeromonas veronii]|uniref:hypothetical protein n=1 Tax=Aeromonas veronii TaxID=654 RepID=UPI003D255441